MQPTISICIPCYKSERFIRTTVESVLAQTVTPLEILISDDNSPDRTLEIISEYSCLQPVRVLRTPRRLTLGEHYRYLMAEAVGDFICFLSHDDALFPSFVEVMRGDVEDGVALIAAACLECDSKLVPRRVRGMALPRRPLVAPQGYLRFRQGNGYTMSFSLMSRRCLIEIQPLPPEADLATDWYWAMMLGLKGTVRFERRPLGYYRVHDSNAGHGDSRRWMGACLSMLSCLRDRVPTEYRQDVSDRTQAILDGISRAGSGEAGAALSLPLRVRNFVKKLIAIRYRRLPKAVALAERGVGISLRS